MTGTSSTWMDSLLRYRGDYPDIVEDCFHFLQEMEERKNLLDQFRQWKERKRKSFNISVTERARREMADQDEQKNKKRTPHSK